MQEHLPQPAPPVQPQYQPQPILRNLPNDTAILVLGICSIVFAMCYGVVGLGLGIAAIIMSRQSLREYNAAPHLFAPSSAANVNAGRVCAIIGVVFGSMLLLALMAYILIYVLFFGAMMSTIFLA